MKRRLTLRDYILPPKKHRRACRERRPVTIVIDGLTHEETVSEISRRQAEIRATKKSLRQDKRLASPGAISAPVTAGPVAGGTTLGVHPQITASGASGVGGTLATGGTSNQQD